MMSSTGRIWYYPYQSCSMASSEWKYMSDEDPWRLSVFISAIVELFLSILLLLGAVLAFVTSRFAKFCNLEPPCTYVGCTHPLHSDHMVGQRPPTPSSCRSNDLCIKPHWYPLEIHSELASRNAEDRSFGEEGGVSRGGDATEQASNIYVTRRALSGEGLEMSCPCSDSLIYKRRKGMEHTAFARASSGSNLSVLSARSGRDSNGGLDEEEHCKISQAAENSEDGWEGEQTNGKRHHTTDDHAHVSLLAYDTEALESYALLEDIKRKHWIPPDAAKSNQMEPLQLYAVHEKAKKQAKKPKTLKQASSSDDPEGSTDDFDVVSRCPPLTLHEDARTTLNCCVPIKMSSSREGLHRKDGTVDAAFPPHNQGENDWAELLKDRCTAANSDAGSSKDDTEQGSKPECGMGLITTGLCMRGNVQGINSNVSKEEEVELSRELSSKMHRELIDQRVADDGFVEKLAAIAHLSSLEAGTQEAIMEFLQELNMEGVSTPCAKDARVSESIRAINGGFETNLHITEGGLCLSMNDLEREVDYVSGGDIAIENLSNEPVATNYTTEPRGMLPLCVSPLDTDYDDACALDGEEEEGLEALKFALRAERSVLAVMEAELENERNAAAVATSEAMAMISRLQEEKSTMQMEVAQLQRVSEEKADYDEQAMALLKEILFKRESENIALEKEVELYREAITAERADELKRNWHSEGAGSPSPQSPKPLLLIGGGKEVRSTIEALNQKRALGSLEMFHQPVQARSAFRVSWSGQDLYDSPRSDTSLSISSKAWDGEGRLKFHLDSGLHGPHDSPEQLKNLGGSVVSTHDEETHLILQRLWVLEEELRELRGKDGVGIQKRPSNAHGVQELVFSPTNRRAEKSLTHPWTARSLCGSKGKECREVAGMDGLSEGFVPTHDVYEVNSGSNRSPPCADERDPPARFEGILGNPKMPPGSDSFPCTRMARLEIQIPPRTTWQATGPVVLDEGQNTPASNPQVAGWRVGKCLHPEDVVDHHDLPSQLLVSTEERHMAMGDIQQLAVRLRALEDDRELLRETLESFKHKDAELDLLQEIARHLRDLCCMGGFTKITGGASPEAVSVRSPSKSRALKKRRYCSSPG